MLSLLHEPLPSLLSLYSDGGKMWDYVRSLKVVQCLKFANFYLYLHVLAIFSELYRNLYYLIRPALEKTVFLDQVLRVTVKKLSHR